MVAGATKIYVKITGEDDTPSIYIAHILAQDAQIDYALLKMEDFHGNFATLETHDTPCILGDEIVILGYPFGSKIDDNVMNLGVSFTKGYISSMQKQNGISRTLLDISAKAGNSGSPVIHMATGQVVGILCGSITNQNNSITEEINYMSPIQHFWGTFTIE